MKKALNEMFIAVNAADILVGLARDQEEIDSSPIESNSILGTQISQANFDDQPLEQLDNSNKEEDEEIPDLNMTNLELDNFNWSQWETIQEKEKTQPQSSRTNESQIGIY